MRKRKQDMIGFRNNQLEVVDDIIHETHGRVWVCVCDCGEKHFIKETASLKTTQSCGCLKSEVLSERNKSNRKYESTDTRVYNMWKDMKKRVSWRDNCELFPDWENFEVFQEFVLSHDDYDDDKMICRKLDKGDYEPDNVYFGTASDNQRDTSQSRANVVYMFTDLNWVYEFKNLSKFCSEFALDKRSMLRVNKGEYKQHKGWYKVVTKGKFIEKLIEHDDGFYVLIYEYEGELI